MPVRDRAAAVHRLDLYHDMLRVRRLQEACSGIRASRGLGGTPDRWAGGEACTVGAARALRTDDAVVAGRTVHALALLRGVSMNHAVAGLTGVAEGAMRSLDPGLRLWGGAAVDGGGPHVAVGIALADRAHGERRMTACVADGAAAADALPEALGLASRWRLPVLFVCESDGIGMGIAGASADGMDVEAVEAGAIAAAGRVRATGDPAVLELLAARASGRDPLVVHADRLRTAGLLDDEGIEEMERAVTDEVAGAVALAEARP